MKKIVKQLISDGKLSSESNSQNVSKLTSDIMTKIRKAKGLNMDPESWEKDQLSQQNTKGKFTNSETIKVTADAYR
jgi:polyhydroxyalkanoate synthesis regulator phasin